jgi:hypothetical protein
MTEQRDAQERALSYKKELEKDLAKLTKAIEANPDD